MKKAAKGSRVTTGKKKPVSKAEAARRKRAESGLVKDAIAARDLGMSYGEYKAMQYAKENPVRRKG